MPVNDPVNDHTEVCKKIAYDILQGKYGNGLNIKQAVNSLGYGNIYKTVEKYVNMIMSGQL